MNKMSFSLCYEEIIYIFADFFKKRNWVLLGCLHTLIDGAAIRCHDNNINGSHIYF